MVGDMDAGKVIGLTGLTYGQLNYLIKQVDVLNREKTQGKARDFSFREVVFLKLASVMRSDGMGLSAINEVMSVLNQYWINENPKDAGNLLKIYLEDSGEYHWTWSPNFYDATNVNMARSPKYYYNAEYYASELSNRDQLELKLEEMAVK